ncbi:MAG: hypothetical protein RIB98_07610 [Acidimicrobiales bacterium]
MAASVGVAHTDKPLDIDTLIARADSAMYDNKERHHVERGEVSPER